MTLGVVAGMHFMEASELNNQNKAARRTKNFIMAQIAQKRKIGEEAIFVTPQEQT